MFYVPRNISHSTPSFFWIFTQSQGEECCAKAYGGQTSMACVCEHLDTPQLGCPGIIEYEKTTVTTVVTSTISFGAITVPTDPDEKAALVSDLEEAILASLLPSLGGDNDVQVRITSIGGVDVRRLLWNHPDARLLSTSDVEVEITVETEVEEDQGSKGSATDPDVAAAAVADQVADQVVSQVTAATSDTTNMENALQNSGNEALTSVTVEGTTVDQNPVTTSSTETVVGVSSFVIVSYDMLSALSLLTYSIIYYRRQVPHHPQRHRLPNHRLIVPFR